MNYKKMKKLKEDEQKQNAVKAAVKNMYRDLKIQRIEWRPDPSYAILFNDSFKNKPYQDILPTKKQEKKKSTGKNEQLEAKIKALREKQSFISKKESFYEVAELYKKKGELEETITILNMGTLAFPEDAWMYGRLGYFIKDYKKSLGVYEKAAKLEPKAYWAWQGIAYNLWKLGKINESLKFYKKAAELRDKTKLQGEK